MASRVWHSFDYLLFLATLALIAYGLAMNYTASLAVYSVREEFLSSPVFRQALFAAGGLAVMVVFAYIDYGVFGKLAWPVYFATLAALVGVIVIGEAVHGSTRWVDIGFTRIQPSEFAKLATIIAVARLFAGRHEKRKKLTTLLMSIAVIVPPLFMVYYQPDLGTMIVLAAIWIGIVVVAGVRLIYLAIMGIAGVVSLPAIYSLVLHGYMRERLETFLDPMKDPLGAGYNVLQSEISVGSGGFWGKGFTNGTQSQLRFLRVPTTDFIFSVLGEELGFVGAMVLFALFVILLFRGLRAASLARDPFGQLIATGIVTMILFQSFINIGVNIRLLPVTGIPLPLISYGGSSMLTILGSLGLVHSIAARPKKEEYFDEPGL